MADLSEMFSIMNAALAQGEPAPADADASARPLTIRPGPSAQDTINSLSSVLAAPKGTPITLGTPIAGSTPALPSSSFSPSSAGGRLYSDTDLGLSSPSKPAVTPMMAATPMASGTGRLYSDADLGVTPSGSPAPTRSISDGAAMADPTPTAPAPGVLSNSSDDGYLSGAAKGTATALVKAAADVPGMFGSAMDMGDYLVARAQAKITGQPLDDVLAAQAAERKASADNPGWSRYLDPRNFLPSGQQIAAPVLAKTGEYVPTSETGRLAQTGVEAAVGSLGFGGGARALLPNAVAGAVGQGATDLTGDPLVGLAAGAATVPAGEAIGASVRGVGKLVAPIAGGSSILNSAPVIGPALQAGREAAVVNKLQAASSDPSTLRARVMATADQPDLVPGSPRTLAGSIGDDAGLYQAEKAARNVDNTQFNAVDRAQSDAQVGALQGAQPAGDVFRPGQVISQRMDAIDTAAQDAIDRLTAAHADAVTNQNAAGQAFATDQQSGLAQRTADRVQAGADFTDQTRADLAGRVADRTQAAADDASQAQAARDDAHAQLVQIFADAHAKQLGAAQDAAAPLGEPMNANDIGSTLRGAVEQVRAGAKDLHRGLYNAVDPDGTLALVATPVGDRASSIMDALKANGAELTPAETPLFRRAAALPDVATYGTLRALDTDLSAAMSTERRVSGESPAWARLTQLKGSVKSAMTNAADNQAAHEARMVDAGMMAPGDTIAARLGQGFGADANEWDAAAAQQATARANTGTGGGADPGPGTVGFPGASGAEIQGGGGPRSTPGDPSLPPAGGGAGQGAAREVGVGPRPDAPAFDPDGPLQAPQRPDVPRPQDLQAFIRAKGGMTDPGGDLRSMGLHDLIAKPGRGVSQDSMRLMAAEAGYLGGDTARAMAETHPNDLLDAVSGDRPVHAVRDQDAAAAWANYDAAKEAHAAARGEFGTRSTFGVKPEPVPLSAYSRDDIDGPGGPALPAPARSGLQPNFGPEAAGRLRAANAAYADYATTYKNPIVGPGLRTTGYSGQYQRSDAGFIKGAIKPGPEGYENARAYLTAAKNDPEALGAMQDAALNPLRRAAVGPGFVHPNALANWKASFGPALRALDEVTPGFSSRFDDAAGATQSLLDLGAEHKTALETVRKEAARQAILDNTARKAQLGQANSVDKASAADLIAERTANDRAAIQADRAGVGSAIAERTAADRAAISQSKADTAAGIASARNIVRDARATPAARFASGGGTGVASTEVENAVGSFLKTGTSGATRMRGLVQSVAQDPEALAGLQTAGRSWIVRNHLNADGSLSGAKLIGFLRENRDSLRELFPHNEVSMMGAVARDAEEGAKWRTTTAIKGGSDTAKNLYAMAGKAKDAVSHLSLGMAAVEAISQGFEHGGMHGAVLGGAGAAGAYLVNSLRQGIKRTSDLYTAALANPELARTLISRMPAAVDNGTLHAFSRALKRSLILGPMAMQAAPPSPGLH